MDKKYSLSPFPFAPWSMQGAVYIIGLYQVIRAGVLVLRPRFLVLKTKRRIKGKCMIGKSSSQWKARKLHGDRIWSCI